MDAVSPAETSPGEPYEWTYGKFVVTDFMGKNDGEGDHPQAFLVDYTPAEGGAIQPHFHDVRQFQVVVYGEGAIGKLPLAPVTFHYADAMSPYGPITTSTDRLVFFTLRADHDPSGHLMPGSKHLMKGRAGRNLALHVDAVDGGDETLLEPQDDGLASYRLHLEPGERKAGPSPAGSGGQYYLVMRGELVDGERTFPLNSLLFVYADEDAAEITAGGEGADVLVMQFPVLAA